MKATTTLLGLLLCSAAHAAAPTPVCQNQRQCEAMWAAAQTAVSTATGMPVRLVTDSRIETHPATSESLLTGVVTKIPSGQEGYKIVIDLACHAAHPVRRPGARRHRAVQYLGDERGGAAGSHACGQPQRPKRFPRRADLGSLSRAASHRSRQ